MQASRFFPDRLQRRLADAVERGDAAAIAEAIRLGANIDKPGNEGMCMLTWAVVKDSVAGFEALLDHGADPKALIRSPRVVHYKECPESIIEFICKVKNKAFLRAVLARGFDPDFIAVPSSGETLLFRAVWAGDEGAVAILLEAGANIDHQDIAGVTPAALAQSISDCKMVCYLMERGGDLTIKDKWGFDIADHIKDYGTRGVGPDQKPYFDKIVAELERRGLITQEDIVNADKPKDNSGSGITTIVHGPDSDIGKAIQQLDRAEQEANRRDGLVKP